MNKENFEPIYPIGSFVIENAKGTQTSNGMYYHYTDVCSLLIKHKQLRESEQDRLMCKFAEWFDKNMWCQAENDKWYSQEDLDASLSTQELINEFKDSLKQ